MSTHNAGNLLITLFAKSLDHPETLTLISLVKVPITLLPCFFRKEAGDHDPLQSGPRFGGEQRFGVLGFRV